MGDRGARDVDLGDLSEEHLGVALAGEHLARRRRDLALGQDPGRDLVEERLEQMVGRAGYEGDLDVDPLEPLGREQATKARPDDHDPMAS